MNELRQKAVMQLTDWCIRHGLTHESNIEELLDVTRKIYVDMIAEMLEKTAELIRKSAKAEKTKETENSW